MPTFFVDNNKPVKDFVDQRLYTRLNGEWFEVKQKPSAEEGIPRPPREVFTDGDQTVTEHLVHGVPQQLPHITKFEYPNEEDGGGIFIHYQDFKYPRKGFPFPEAVQANNIAKRLFVGQVRYLAKNPLAAVSLLRRKNLDKWLQELSSACNISLGQFRLKEFRYQKSCREIRKFLSVFLKEIKINNGTANEFSEVVASMFEWDDAYLVILRDLASATTKEKLKKDIAGELARLFNLFKQRDPRPKMHDTFGSPIKLLRLAFFVPGVKKAFLKALDEINFENLQMDDADKYNALRWQFYNVGGRPLEERWKEFMDIHEGVHPRMLILKHD